MTESGGRLEQEVVGRSDRGRGAVGRGGREEEITIVELEEGTGGVEVAGASGGTEEDITSGVLEYLSELLRPSSIWNI